jgi:hypothetical protein
LSQKTASKMVVKTVMHNDNAFKLENDKFHCPGFQLSSLNIIFFKRLKQSYITL